MDISLAESVWSVLARMVDDMRRRGVSIPRTFTESIVDCRRLVNHHKAGHNGRHSGALLATILEELRKLEDKLVIEAFVSLGDDYVQDWESRLSQIWSLMSVPTREMPIPQAQGGVENGQPNA